MRKKQRLTEDRHVLDVADDLWAAFQAASAVRHDIKWETESPAMERFKRKVGNEWMDVLEDSARFFGGEADSFLTDVTALMTHGKQSVTGDEVIDALEEAEKALRSAGGDDPFASGIEAAAEAPPGAPLDRIAFADHREGVPKEPDNRSEAQLYAALKRHVSSKQSPLPNRQAALASSIIAAGQYRRLFKEPTARLIYRGMHTLSRAWMAAALGDDFEDSGESTARFVYRPQENGSGRSWTVDQRVAASFADNCGRGTYWVIMRARSGDNPGVFLDLDPLYGPLATFGEAGEQEVVALGPVAVEWIKWGKNTGPRR